MGYLSRRSSARLTPPLSLTQSRSPQTPILGASACVAPVPHRLVWGVTNSTDLHRGERPMADEQIKEIEVSLPNGETILIHEEVTGDVE